MTTKPVQPLTSEELALQIKWLDEWVEPHFDNDGQATTKNAVALYSALRQAHATIEVLTRERDATLSIRWTPTGDNHHNAWLCPHCNVGNESPQSLIKRAEHANEGMQILGIKLYQAEAEVARLKKPFPAHYSAGVRVLAERCGIHDVDTVVAIYKRIVEAALSPQKEPQV